MASVRGTVAALVADGRYGDIAAVCEKAEVEAGSLNAQDWPHALHMLSHVLNKDLELARLVWKRVPEQAKQGNAELAAVWDLVAALWRRDYPAIGAALRSPAFTPATAGAVAACAAAHRKSTLHLLSVAYTTISVADTAEALALSPPEALAAVTAAGWQVAADDPQWLNVAPPAPTPEVATDAMSLQTLLGYAVAAGS